jgi:hypothetical protein
VQARRKPAKRRQMTEDRRQRKTSDFKWFFPDEKGASPFLRKFVGRLFTFIFQEVLFTRAKIRVPNVLSKKKISHFSHILHTGAFARRYFFSKNPDEKGFFAPKRGFPPFERQRTFSYPPSTKLNSNTTKLNSINFLFNSTVFLFNNKSAELK